MKVMVTGGAGKVGRMVCAALAGRHELRIFDLVPVEPTEGATVVGSILDRAALAGALEGVDAVVHLAFASNHRLPREELEAVNFDVNAKGTWNVAQAAATAGVRRVVYSSSLSVYDGNHPADGERFSEEIAPAPSGFYALTKYFGEEILRAHARRGSFSAACLRLTLPTFPEEWEAIRARGGDSACARTAARDVGEAFRLAVEREDLGFEVFHIASEHPACRWDIGKARRVLGYQPTTWFA